MSALTETEEAVAELWREVLTCSARIAPTDDFFALGGDSLGMTLLLFRVGETFGVEVPPPSLLEAPELRAFCRRIDSLREAQASASSVL